MPLVCSTLLTEMNRDSFDSIFSFITTNHSNFSASAYKLVLNWACSRMGWEKGWFRLGMQVGKMHVGTIHKDNSM